VAIDANDPRSPYRQLAATIRAMIANGTVAPGAKLPSNRELMDSENVASQTVQRAIRLLADEGLVRSVQGRGTFVADDVDPAAIVVDDGVTASTGDYLMLRDRIDQLDSEVEEIRHLLEEVVSRLPPVAQPKPGAPRSGSARPRH